MSVAQPCAATAVVLATGGLALSSHRAFSVYPPEDPLLGKRPTAQCFAEAAGAFTGCSELRVTRSGDFNTAVSANGGLSIVTNGIGQTTVRFVDPYTGRVGRARNFYPSGEGDPNAVSLAAAAMDRFMKAVRKAANCRF